MAVTSSLTFGVVQRRKQILDRAGLQSVEFGERRPPSAVSRTTWRRPSVIDCSRATSPCR